MEDKKKFVTSLGGGNEQFRTTIWSDILNAKDRASRDYRQKMGYLIQIYWKPVYMYIQRKWKRSNEDAKDLTQEFFTTFLTRDLMKIISPEKGRFRTYLRVLLKHFMLDDRRKSSAKKRGGDASIISISHFEDHELADSKSGDPESLFDIDWARCVIDSVILEMERQLTGQGKEIRYRIFKIYDLDQNSLEKLTYTEVAKNLGIRQHDVRNHLVKARKLFKKLMLEEVSKYVSNPDDAEEELKTLLDM